MHETEPPEPNHPEPSPDATVRLPTGTPSLDPRATQKLPLTALPDAGGTVKIPRADLDLGGAPEATQKLILPTADEQPIRAQKIALPAGAAGHTESSPAFPEPRSGGWKLPLALGALALLGAVTYFLFSRGTAAPPPAPSAPAVAEATPPGAQAYLEQAKAGDAHAMRMLGVMYYYGLNVPQDREKGLSWYRQAAERGSEAARAELAKLEAAGK